MFTRARDRLAALPGWQLVLVLALTPLLMFWLLGHLYHAVLPAAAPALPELLGTQEPAWLAELASPGGPPLLEIKELWFPGAPDLRLTRGRAAEFSLELRNPSPTQEVRLLRLEAGLRSPSSESLWLQNFSLPLPSAAGAGETGLLLAPRERRTLQLSLPLSSGLKATDHWLSGWLLAQAEAEDPLLTKPFPPGAAGQSPGDQQEQPGRLWRGRWAHSLVHVEPRLWGLMDGDHPWVRLALFGVLYIAHHYLVYPLLAHVVTLSHETLAARFHGWACGPCTQRLKAHVDWFEILAYTLSEAAMAQYAAAAPASGAQPEAKRRNLKRRRG